ncbi:MAG: glycosyltransferase family 2 protein [Hyphomicrobiales bacterium]|nr:glycosyltransferase family 2 protein [Hyphomicrobiales bacterium]
MSFTREPIRSESLLAYTRASEEPSFMSLVSHLYSVVRIFLDPFWLRLWTRVERRVAPIEARIALVENALNTLQRNPAAFFEARSIGALSTSTPIRREDYDAWITQFDRLRPGEDHLIRRHTATLAERPKFSLIIAAHGTIDALSKTIASVREQIYDDWELFIPSRTADGHAGDLLSAPETIDARIKAARFPGEDVSNVLKAAVEASPGHFAALLHAGDILAPHALASMADAVNRHSDADIFYSDEDKIDSLGRRYEPWFKPDWNPELLRGQDYISHFGVFRMKHVRALLRPNQSELNVQDWNVRLASSGSSRVVHVPHILCHRLDTMNSNSLFLALMQGPAALQGPTSTQGEIAASESPENPTIAGTKMLRAMSEASVDRQAGSQWPRVSVIIATRDRTDLLAQCLQGLWERTEYPDIEILIADNDSSQPKTVTFFAEVKKRGVRVVSCPGPFNHSKINNRAARHASGDVLLLLNNDVEMLEPGWLKAMIGHLFSPDVAAVGAKLLYPDGTLQHGGVVLGMLGVAGHVHLGASIDSPGYRERLRLAQDVSCVTAACIAVRRSVFEEVGGFDEDRLAVDFNDVDLCIRIRQAGHRIIWTPHAALVHHESKSRGSPKEKVNQERLNRAAACMRQRWGSLLDRDPFWNPNLSLQSTEPRITFPPRVSRPWHHGAG